MPSPEERLATLEQVARDIRDDLRERSAEEQRTRGRLHKLEKVTAGLVELQRQMHRQNEAKLQRVTIAIQWGGLFIGIGMFALALVTYLAHAH